LVAKRWRQPVGLSVCCRSGRRRVADVADLVDGDTEPGGRFELRRRTPPT
jgi:hypothetical protein